MLHTIHCIVKPKIYDVANILAGVGFSNYIIAGGAIRDSIFGKAIKDIDVFYWGTLPTDILNLFDAQPLNNNEYTNPIFQCKYKGMFGNTPIDFIQVSSGKPPYEVVHSFPCSISQVYVSQFHLDNGSVCGTDWFLQSKMNGTIIFDEEVSDEYHDRILGKYSNIPEDKIIYTPTSVFYSSTAGTAALHNTTTIANNTFWNESNILEQMLAQVDTVLHNNTVKLKIKPKEPIKYRVINTHNKDCFKEMNEW